MPCQSCHRARLPPSASRYTSKAWLWPFILHAYWPPPRFGLCAEGGELLHEASVRRHHGPERSASGGEDLLALLAQLALRPDVPVERHGPDPKFAAECGHGRVTVRHRSLGQPHLGFRQREHPAAVAAARPRGREPGQGAFADQPRIQRSKRVRQPSAPGATLRELFKRLYIEAYTHKTMRCISGTLGWLKWSSRSCSSISLRSLFVSSASLARAS